MHRERDGFRFKQRNRFKMIRMTVSADDRIDIFNFQLKLTQFLLNMLEQPTVAGID